MYYGMAIDMGYRYIKGVNEDGEKFLSLSLVGIASQRHLSNIFGYDSKDDLHVKIEGSGIETTEAFVGDLARRESRTVSAAFDTNKIHHPNTKILLATAAGRLMPGERKKIHLVSGLPIDDFYRQKDEFQKFLEEYNVTITYFRDGKEAEKKEIAFDKVTLFPQAAGAVYHALSLYRQYFQKGYLIGLIDIGMRTTDIIVFEVSRKFQIRQQYCKTLEIGIATFYHEVINKVNEKIGSNFDTTKIDMVLQNPGDFYYRGREYDLTEIIEDARVKVAQAIKDRLATLWGSDLDAFRVVFLGGGGSIELQDGLSNIHHTTVLLDDCQFANAYGFLKVHEIVMRQLAVQENVINFRETLVK